MNLTSQKLWRGGDCPIDPEARVIVTYRDGIVSKIRIAGDLRWAWEGLNDDITAYRLVEQ